MSRHLDIDGCFNVRDAGDWPTADGRRMRLGRLYRADDPVRLTAEGRQRIAELGLRAVIDLRQQGQVDRGHLFVPAQITHHIPLVDHVIDVNDPPRLDHADDLVALYDDMVVRGRTQIVKAIDLIAASLREGPVMVHCVAGKDRTGLVVALVQAAIGVEQPSIVEEYALSHEPTQRRRTAMLDTPLADDPPVHRSPPMIWSAPAAVMASVTDRVIAAHGSIGAWPAALGVSAATIEALRRELLA